VNFSGKFFGAAIPTKFNMGILIGCLTRADTLEIFTATVSMLKTPLVSVVMPAFNAARFIEQTLESARCQTFQDFEVLVVDDGSTDDTAAVAQKFCETDARFQLLRRSHNGLSATRNAGIERTRGEFIAFLDADDVWSPEKLECQMALFRADPRVNFSYTNFHFWDGQLDLEIYYRANRPLPDCDAARQLIFANVYCISTVVTKRELFDKAGVFDTALLDGCEDWDLWLRLAEHGLYARGTHKPLARYRRWPGNMSNKKLKMAENDVRVLKKNLLATRRPELRPLYRQSLNFARGKLELARARPLVETAPDFVPAAVWRAWRFHPQRLKWLMWYLLAAWPKFLGGNKTARIVHRKLVQKF
jgi:glycosyltransferase involved in cell wall biosynthesis